MSKKLAAKSALIEIPGIKQPVVQYEADAVRAKPRTAVGGMASFVSNQSVLHKEVDELRAQLKSFDGSLVMKTIDPALIVASDWANRHEDNFDSIDFGNLKKEIQESGGNIQPIKVRALSVDSEKRNTGAEYEIIFGHRRHRACLQLQIPVNVIVENVDDKDLFEQMERENRARKNLSAWEQGKMYDSALQRGLYLSQRKLAQAIGIDVSIISKSVALAKLPVVVVAAFRSPLDIQYRWTTALTEALKRDEPGMQRRAEEVIRQRDSQHYSATEIMEILTDQTAGSGNAVKFRKININNKDVAEFSVDSKGTVTLKIKAKVLNTVQSNALFEVVENFLSA